MHGQNECAIRWFNMGWGYGQIDQFDAALDHCRQAEQIYLPLVTADPADNGLRYKLAVIRRNAGIINGYAKRWSDGAAEFAKGIADYDVLLKAGPNKRYRIYQADLTMRMANALLAAGRSGEAETAAAAGISTFREIAHSQDVAFADIRVLVTYLLESPLAAVRDPKEALALLDQPRWRGQADTFEFNEVLAMAYHENHRYREAADTMRKALALMPPTKPGDRPNRARQEIDGHLWIANNGANNVIKANASTGHILQIITDGVSGPARLAFDSLGNLYVANKTANTVTEYDPAGTLIRTISGSFIQGPLGVAVDAYGDVYIANNAANNVVAVNDDGGLVETLTADKSGFAFTAPGALAISGQDLYVGLGPGVGENAVISYNVGEFLTGDPKEQGVFTNSVDTGPTGVTFDGGGNVYVADFYAGKWVQYSSSGVLQLAVSAPSPEGIAWDKTTGYIYVTNSGANNIGVFTTSGTSVTTLF